MFKRPVTPIRKIHTFSLTPRLSVWILTAIFWIIISSGVTYLTIYHNVGIPRFTCQATTFVSPTVSIQVEDKSKKVLVSKLTTQYNVKPELAKTIVNTVDIYTEKQKFPSRELVLAIMATESTFRPSATSNVSAKGLMQVMPLHKAGSDMFSNIQAGINILREYHKQLNGNTRQTLLAYNSGIGTVINGKVANYGYADKVFRELKIIKG